MSEELSTSTGGHAGDGRGWWRGLMPAAVTPFTEDGQIDSDSLERHLQRVAGEAGVVGVVVLGHAGEVLALSSDERAEVVRLARRCLPEGVRLVAGIEAGTAELLGVEGARAVAAGADALLVLPPFDARPFRALSRVADVVAATFRVVCERAGAPVIVFQYPESSGCAYSLEALDAMADVAGVVAVKAATGNIAEYIRIRERLQSRVGILAAADSPVLLAMMLHGCDGVLAGISTVGTRIWANVLTDVWGGREGSAVRTFRERCELLTWSIYENQLHVSDVSTFAATKEALYQLGELRTPMSRPPSVMPGEERRLQIARALAACGLERIEDPRVLSVAGQ